MKTYEQKMEAFKAKMNTLSTDGVIAAMRSAWNKPEGIIFREAGFDIIDERLGEDASDKIYDNLWYEMHGKAA